MAGAGLLPLAGCFRGGSASLDDAEKPSLTTGFILINCATPITVASPLGIYEKYGFDVTVRKFGGWSEIRDAAITDEIGAAHLLAPIPLALSMSLGAATIPMRLAAIENINGQTITLALKHLGNVDGPADLAGMTPEDVSFAESRIRAETIAAEDILHEDLPPAVQEVW